MVNRIDIARQFTKQPLTIKSLNVPEHHGDRIQVFPEGSTIHYIVKDLQPGKRVKRTQIFDFDSINNFAQRAADILGGIQANSQIDSNIVPSSHPLQSYVSHPIAADFPTQRYIDIQTPLPQIQNSIPELMSSINRTFRDISSNFASSNLAEGMEDVNFPRTSLEISDQVQNVEYHETNIGFHSDILDENNQYKTGKASYPGLKD